MGGVALHGCEISCASEWLLAITSGTRRKVRYAMGESGLNRHFGELSTGRLTLYVPSGPVPEVVRHRVF
jgi:hypothetical protein